MAFNHALAAVNALFQSLNLVPLPVESDSVVYVDADDYSTWDECLTDCEGYHRVVLRPGDYTPWGDLRYDSAYRSGTAGNPRVISLDYPVPSYARTDADMALARTQHPVNLPEEARARVAQVVVDHQSHVMISGLWCDTGQAWQVQNRYSNVTIDMCLIERTGAAFAIRATNGDAATFQRLVIRDSQEEVVVQDRGGLNAKAIGDGATEIVTNCRWIDCEVYNCTDCGSVTDASGAAGGTVHLGVWGCDFYRVNRSFTHVENFIDLKIGDPLRQSSMQYCRMWGDLGKESPTGSTDSFTIHRLTNNWVLEQLIIDSNPNIAFRENWGDNQLWEQTRNLVIRDSWVNRATDVFHVRSDAQLSGVIGLDCGYMVNTNIARANIGGPTHSGNIRMGRTGLKRPGVKYADYTYDEPDNVHQATAAYGYWRKRWTGPEYARAGESFKRLREGVTRGMKQGLRR